MHEGGVWVGFYDMCASSLTGPEAPHYLLSPSCYHFASLFMYLRDTCFINFHRFSKDIQLGIYGSLPGKKVLNDFRVVTLCSHI